MKLLMPTNTTQKALDLATRTHKKTRKLKLEKRNPQSKPGVKSGTSYG